MVRCLGPHSIMALYLHPPGIPSIPGWLYTQASRERPRSEMATVDSPVKEPDSQVTIIWMYRK